MTMSAAGSILAFNALSPKWADLSQGLAWAVVLSNPTAADMTSGTFTIEAAPADPDNACLPDDTKWAAVSVTPACDAAPGTAAAPATIALSASNPLKAYSQCQYAVPCVAQFVRVVGGTPPAGIDVLAVVTRLRRIMY